MKPKNKACRVLGGRNPGGYGIFFSNCAWVGYWWASVDEARGHPFAYFSPLFRSYYLGIFQDRKRRVCLRFDCRATDKKRGLGKHCRDPFLWPLFQRMSGHCYSHSERWDTLYYKFTRQKCTTGPTKSPARVPGLKNPWTFPGKWSKFPHFLTNFVDRNENKAYNLGAGPQKIGPYSNLHMLYVYNLIEDGRG